MEDEKKKIRRKKNWESEQDGDSEVKYELQTGRVLYMLTGLQSRPL